MVISETTRAATTGSGTELFSATSYSRTWAALSDVWVLLNPDSNSWTEQIDWSLGMLLRRTLLRLEVKPSKAGTVLLLAAPEGMPAARVLVLQDAKDGEWLAQIGPVLTKMQVGIATVFAPRDWRPPQPKAIAEISQGEWGLRWVEPGI